MWCIVVRIGKIKERVDIKCIGFASHIGDRRRFINIFRRTPQEEIGIFIAHIVDVESIVEQIAVVHRLVVSQVASGTETFVVSLFFISFIREHVQSGRKVEIADAAGMWEIDSFIYRITDTWKYVLTQEWFHFVFAFFPEWFVTPPVFFVLRISVDT